MVGIAGVVVVVVLVALGGPVLGRATVFYLRHARVFVAIGLTLIPVGLVANAVQVLVVRVPPVELLVALLERSPGSRLAVALTVGGVQQLAGLILAGPAVIAAVGDIQRGQPAGPVRAYRVAFARLRSLARATWRPLGAIAALAVSEIGIPWAVRRAVAW